MGMYTELIIKCSIKEDVPDFVIDILDKMFNDHGAEIFDLPDHEFFKCERWDWIGSSSSYYHTPFALSKFQHDEISSDLFSRSDLKNYDCEIEKFINWIMPYIDEEPGHCIGWEWYEEDEKPTLLFKE